MYDCRYKGKMYFYAGLVEHVKRNGEIIEMSSWTTVCNSCGGEFMLKAKGRPGAVYEPPLFCFGCYTPKALRSGAGRRKRRRPKRAKWTKAKAPPRPDLFS
jgi:hypothetical protein